MSESEEIHRDKPLWPEDTVEYRLFPLTESHYDLTKLAVECTHFARAVTRGHLWNYGEFLLRAWKEDGSSTNDYPAHLHGRTCFRDNIEDEWLIVHLLFALSKHNTNLVISVADGDGEFLLIQAARYLPKWLKPESAINRVFIHNGLVHIIPKPSTPAEITRLPVAIPTIKEAIAIVSDPLILTAASEPIQSSIQSRIKRFSESLDFLYHHAHCYLPLSAAHVISHDPQLVTAAVHALCDRDPTDTSVIRNSTHSVFSPLKQPSMTTTVQFTKLLYAKLVHENFRAPHKSGFAVPPAGSPDHRSRDIGMKLTCGLEMLVKRVRSASCEAGVRSAPCEASVEGDPRWLSFIASLKEKGYFRGEIEGSKGHQQLMASAKEYFVQCLNTDQSDEKQESSGSSAGQRAMHIVQNISYSEEELKKKGAGLPPPDDDSWLELKPEDLEEMLQHSAGYLPRSGHDADQQQPASAGGLQMEGSKVTDSEELELESLVFGMRSFVDKVSSHKGAEFPWTVDEASGVTFDSDSFLSTLQEMLGQGEHRQPASGSDSEGTLSGDDLSVSSEESEAGDVCKGGGDGDGLDASVGGDAGDAGEGGPSISQLMAEMDLELAQTELGKSFEKAQDNSDERSKGHLEELQPVDVDFNLVKNLLDSYTSQGGGAGPASNILGSLGVHIPDQPQST